MGARPGQRRRDRILERRAERLGSEDLAFCEALSRPTSLKRRSGALNLGWLVEKLTDQLLSWANEIRVRLRPRSTRPGSIVRDGHCVGKQLVEKGKCFDETPRGVQRLHLPPMAQTTAPISTAPRPSHPAMPSSSSLNRSTVSAGAPGSSVTRGARRTPALRSDLRSTRACDRSTTPSRSNTASSGPHRAEKWHHTEAHPSIAVPYRRRPGELSYIARAGLSASPPGLSDISDMN